MNMRQIGENIRQVRESLRLSRNDVEEKTGINFSYIGQIERGETNPSIEIIIKLAKAFNVTTSRLIGEDKIPDIYYLDFMNLVNSKAINMGTIIEIFDRYSEEELQLIMNCLKGLKKKK